MKIFECAVLILILMLLSFLIGIAEGFRIIAR